MAQQRDDVMELCCEISARDQIEVALKNAAQGFMWAGLGASVGGLALGPLGFPVGGALGGLWAWFRSGQFQSLPEILMELPPERQQKLCEDVMAVLGNLVWKDSAQLIGLVTGQKTLLQQVTEVLVCFVRNDLGAEVRSRR